ncbi:transmembrane amino acid transporter protein-domain-containing protein [Pilobolus umbonatus]|nr:transmembrane amino acid transporter protein-domain-containing protein [Pilobolus umbonatus]
MSHKEDHLRNIYPNHRISTSQYVEDIDDDNANYLGTSITSRIESFVGSYSRASMMHMAENVIISADNKSLLDVVEDGGSVYTTNIASLSLSRRNSEASISERTPLVFSNPLMKIETHGSVYTIADSYISTTSYHKKSSFTQSIFNSINILIGVGILALPLSFKAAGWFMGLSIFIFCFGLTNYTAKLLAKCLDADPQSRTYGDMGAYAFGVKGRVFISFLFLTELITCSVALVVLLSDGIDSLFPGNDPFYIRLISFLILTPTLFIPVRHLSYTSLLGILSVISLTMVILYDGFTKPTAPGSLIEFADTSILPSNWLSVPLSFGLIMAGFAGHAVFPTIYRDMQNPKEFKQMVNYTYYVTAAVYLTVAVCGYAMFGSSTMQENIVRIPEYNQALNRLAVWLIALNPIAKYGLTLNPVAVSWQVGLFTIPEVDHWLSKGRWRKTVVKTTGVILTSAMIVALAVILPGFDKIMSFLGALFSFIISGIFPIACHYKLFKNTMSKKEILMSYALIAVCCFMAITGTLRSMF